MEPPHGWKSDNAVQNQVQERKERKEYVQNAIGFVFRDLRNRLYASIIHTNFLTIVWLASL